MSTTISVGHAGRRLAIEDGWRVLDVGSGHNPAARADVLLERLPDDDWERGGGSMDAADPRLVIGDACAMPFGDHSFDFIIASHIAEHVEDPTALCRELVRVGRAGYIETPGWLGDIILREDYHRWRVRRRGAGLHFKRVPDGARPLGSLGEAVYALMYAGEHRPGHRTLRPRNRGAGWLARQGARVLGRIWRLPGIRSRMYTCFEYRGPFPVTVDDGT